MVRLGWARDKIAEACRFVCELGIFILFSHFSMDFCFSIEAVALFAVKRRFWQGMNQKRNLGLERGVF